MQTVTKHAQGTFCWPELATSDPEAAKKFYGSLMGWTANEIPMPPEAGGGSYIIFQLGGKDVGAATRMDPESTKRGVPPHWGAYVAVNSADAAAKKAKELGATVMMEPFDVMGTVGRMAVIQDPIGAVFCVWQAGTNIGAQVLDEPGALTWTELMTSDTAKAKAFYTALIGWKTEAMPMGQGEYTLFKTADGAKKAGMMGITKEMGPMPPYWLSYFQVRDIEKTVGQAKGLGAKVMVEIQSVPNVARFAILTDPQGAAFALHEPAR